MLDESCELTSVSAGVKSLSFLRNLAQVSKITVVSPNIHSWSNRSGGASPSATKISVQTRSNSGLIQPTVISEVLNVEAVTHCFCGQRRIQVFAD